MFVYCVISDHTDGTVVPRATNNVDACTQCAYLFFLKNFSEILRNYQMNSSTLANELINIFGNASIGTAVNKI